MCLIRPVEWYGLGRVGLKGTQAVPIIGWT